MDHNTQNNDLLKVQKTLVQQPCFTEQYTANPG